MSDSISTAKPSSAPKDVFFHLLMIGTLYASAVCLITLLWQFVNKAFPDALSADSARGIREALRSALATLVVVFPVFSWLTGRLEHEFKLSPERRLTAIRRWLLSLTLFIAGITIIVDVAVLVYNYLGGDLSGRFLLKVLSVFIVAGLVFAYYIWDLKRQAPGLTPHMRYLAYAVMAFVAGSVIAGFALAGSPFTERLRRYDDQRVIDLQSIQYQTVEYWRQKQQLPKTLDALTDAISGYVAPTDPETMLPYEYRISEERTFELCATFALATMETDASLEATRFEVYPKSIGPGGYVQAETPQTWSHGAGRFCYARTIDPEIYKPYESKAVPPMPAAPIR